MIPSEPPPKYAETVHPDSASTNSSGFRRRALRRANTREGLASDRDEEDEGLPGHMPIMERDRDWGIGDDARMGLE